METNDTNKDWKELSFFSAGATLCSLQVVVIILGFLGLLFTVIGFFLLFESGHPLTSPCLISGVSLLLSAVFFMALQLLCRAAYVYLDSQGKLRMVEKIKPLKRFDIQFVDDDD